MEKDKGRRVSIRNMKKEAAKVRKSSRWRCGMSKGTFSGVKVTVLWVTYVFLGSLAFQYIEDTLVVTETTTEHRHWIRFKELTKGHKVEKELLQLKESLQLICPTSVDVNKTFDVLSDMAAEKESDNDTISERVGEHMGNMVTSCGSALSTVERLTKGKRWSLVDSIYYTMTAVTTIGYGHIYPATPAGRLFCVLYCLVGVPLTCILLAKSTDLLSSRMQRLYNTAQRRHRGMGRSLLYWVTVVYLTVGFLVFMLLPSILLTKLEDWTLEEALYCIFITLTTIGFGDFYPGYDEDRDYMEYKNLYKMIIVIWIMVALGYWFLLLNFLQKVMRKNMPQRLKKELRRSKKFKTQSEFFRQLVSKVMSQGVQPEQAKKGGGAESSGVVALMVEVADALESRRPSVAPPPGGKRESCFVPLTLDQLLEVQVAVRGEAVPSIRTLVATSPHPSSPGLTDLLDQTAHKEPEVTLPLREVLTLVTVIKSVEDQVGHGVEGSQQEGMSSSSTPSSPMSTVTSYDQQDYMPLIRSRKDGKEVLAEVDADDEDDDEDEDDDLEEEDDEDDDDDDDEEDGVVMMSNVEKGKKCGRFNVVL